MTEDDVNAPPVPRDFFPKPLRVLIVEDHRMVAEGIAAHLTQRGIEVVAIAAGAAEAVEAASAHHPSVVLMDLRLPDGSGVDATSRILKTVPEASVLLVTGSDPGEEVIFDALAVGCAGFVHKTTGLADLDEAVRAVHAGKAVVPPAVLTRIAGRRRAMAARTGVDLSARELQVLQLLARAEAVSQIARIMGISDVTVENHIHRAMEKLQAHNRLEAVIYAMREGLISPPTVGE